MILVDLHARHWRWSFVDLEERTEADITMPGIRTSLFMVFAVRSRNRCMLKPERMVIWILGTVWRAASARWSDVLASGKRIDLAALVAAFSNLGTWVRNEVCEEK